MPCLGGLVNTLLKKPIEFVYEHAAYPFKTRTNVERLLIAANDLQAQREDIQRQIANGKNNGLKPTSVAETWLQQVGSFGSASDRIKARYDQRCRIFGCCFPNCWSNYKISKNAVKRHSEVDVHLKARPTELTVEPELLPVIEIPTPSDELLPSQKEFLENAVGIIRDGRAGMIGLWGTEGIGKTLILKKINNSFVGNTPFEFVIFLTASRECSVLKIQTEIIKRLKLIRDDDVISQATKIRNFLTGKRFLVLVDDLWERVDLLAVGIPSHLGIQDRSNQKVVITTRFQDVCDQMDVKKAMEIPRLLEDEARKLFEENCGPFEENDGICEENFGDANLYSHSRIGSLAKDLVKELNGIPFKLTSVAKTMCRKKDTKEWEDVIHKLKNPQKSDSQLSLVGGTIKDLEDKMQTLHEKSNDVRHQIEIGRRNGKIARNEITRWLRRADSITSSVKGLAEQYKLNNSDVGERIPEMLRKVEVCLTDQPSNIDLEALPPAVQLQEMPGTSLLTQDRNLEEALRLIRKDQLGMVGIWGPGGVGKTRLLKMINNSFYEDSFFDVVIYVTAAKESSVNQIQAEIVTNQNLKKDEDTVSQARIIHDFLTKRNFLLLIDGLWDKVDLHAVGIPYPLGTTSAFKRTVVLTTRLQDVCNSMEAKKQIIKVCCLREDEAQKLFEEIVGQETLSYHPDIKSRAKDIVKEINGLPLGLVDIGSELHGKTDLGYWDSVSKHMQQSCRDENGPKSVQGVFKKLMYSYEKLRNQTLRDCFRTCSLWPEGREIVKDDLAHCWMGLGLVDEFDKAYGLIGELEAASLLEGTDMGITVKMHDLFRDMALQISGDKWVVHTGHANSGPEVDAGPLNDFLKILAPELLRGPKPLNGALARNFPWSNAECVSLMWNHMGDLPRVGLHGDFQNLKTLCLKHNLLDENTVSVIQRFTMLTYLDLSWNKLKKIPEELCGSAILEYLNLSHNSDICEVPDSFRNLIKLKFLFLGGTSIQSIPQGVISSLTKLQVLDMWSGSVPGMSSALNCVLSVCPELDSLNDLKEVDIVVGGVSEYELLSKCPNLPLRKVTLQNMDSEHAKFHLSGGIFEDNLLGQTLSHLEIVKSNMVNIFIGKNVEEPDYPFEALEMLKLECLEQLKAIMWHQLRPQDTFPRLYFLEVTYCDKLEHISCAMYLPCLRQLYLNYCESIREAFWISKNMPKTPTFLLLEVLHFTYLEGLVSICSSDVTFPSLRSLSFRGCKKLERLPFNMQTSPPNLQEIVFEKMRRWEKLEWEEGVESLLEKHRKIEELDDEDEVTKLIQFILPFYPSNTGYRGGRCPCDRARMKESKDGEDASSSSSESECPDVHSSSLEPPLTFSMGSSTQPSSSTRDVGSTSRRRRVVPRRSRGPLSSTRR